MMNATGPNFDAVPGPLRQCTRGHTQAGGYRRPDASTCRNGWHGSAMTSPRHADSRRVEAHAAERAARLAYHREALTVARAFAAAERAEGGRGW